MIKARVTLKDLDGVVGFGFEVPVKAQKHGKRMITRMANFVERSVKVRTSQKDRWAASGELSRSIRVNPGKNKNELILSANARSAIFQEKGFTPHFVSMEHLSERALRSMKNYQLGQAKKGTGTGKRGLIYVTKSTKYIEPALEELDKRIDRIIDEELNKMLR